MKQNRPPFLIAGNWKMNLNLKEATLLAHNIGQWSNAHDQSDVELLICPATAHINRVMNTLSEDGSTQTGGQDCSFQDHGAHTGDVSAHMLKDLGCEYVILGHSERRTDHKESDNLIKRKAEKALSEGLKIIVCVGETLEEREKGAQEIVIEEQLSNSLPEAANGENCVIAYEPVWAIGTGKTAKSADVKAMHRFIHGFLASRLAKSQSLRIIYGGSVKPENAKDLLSLEHVSGALIGGASLKADSFLAIAEAATSI